MLWSIVSLVFAFEPRDLRVIVVTAGNPEGDHLTFGQFQQYEAQVHKQRRRIRRRNMFVPKSRSKSGRGIQQAWCPPKTSPISCGAKQFGKGREIFPGVKARMQGCQCYNYFGHTCYAACVPNSLHEKGWLPLQVSATGKGSWNVHCPTKWFSTSCSLWPSHSSWEHYPTADFDLNGCRCYDDYGGTCTGYCFRMANLLNPQDMHTSGAKKGPVSVSCPEYWTALGCGYTNKIGRSQDKYAKYPSYYLEDNKCHFYQHEGFQGTVRCIKRKPMCQKITIQINNHTSHVEWRGAPSACQSVDQVFNNCKSNTKATMTTETGVSTSVTTSNTLTLSKSLSKTFTTKIGATATAKFKAFSFVDVSLTVSSDLTWSHTKTKTRTKATTKSTTNVNTFKTSVEVTVDEFNAKELRVMVYKNKGYISWQGTATCMDRDGHTVETKPVEGTWRGAGVSTGTFTSEDVSCDKNPTPGIKHHSFEIPTPSPKRSTPSPRTPRPTTPKKSYYWSQPASGCCNTQTETLYNGYLGLMDDLENCKALCEGFGELCGWVMYGWENSNWCSIRGAWAPCTKIVPCGEASSYRYVQKGCPANQDGLNPARC